MTFDEVMNAAVNKVKLQYISEEELKEIPENIQNEMLGEPYEEIGYVVVRDSGSIAVDAGMYFLVDFEKRGTWWTHPKCLKLFDEYTEEDWI